MTKRSQWVLTCLMFALFWSVVSLFLWVLVFPVFMVVVSLLMIMLPVGVSDNPTPKHDARKWGNR